MAVKSITVQNTSDQPQQLAALGVVMQPGDDPIELLKRMPLARIARYKELQDLMDAALVAVTLTNDEGVFRFDSGALDFVDHLMPDVTHLQSSQFSPVPASMQIIADMSVRKDLDYGKLMRINSFNQAQVYNLNAGVADDHYLGKLLSLNGVMAIIENVPLTWFEADEAIAKGASIAGSNDGTVRTARGADVVLGTALTRAREQHELILIRYQ